MIGTLPSSPVAIDQARLWVDHWRVAETYPNRNGPMQVFRYLCESCQTGETVPVGGEHECWNCGSAENIRRA